MKKAVLFALALAVSLAVFCQTPLQSFQINVTAPQGLSQADIGRYISKINFENYRLRAKRTKLTFDNGFDIILLSASEVQAMGLINNASAYQAGYIPKFELPVFHMTPDGKVSAAYKIINSKYSTKNH